MGSATLVSDSVLLLIQGGDSLNQCCALESDDESWEISDLMARASECYENMKTSPNGNHYTTAAIVNAIGKASVITSE